MYRAVVFAGTTEGYGIARYLADHGIRVLACVATEYGSKSLTETEDLQVSAARLTQEEMEQLFAEHKPQVVVDATHPYAAVVTANIRQACAHTGYPYVRLLREESAREKQAVYVDSLEDAVEYLKGTQGNILSTTGSKELKTFTALPQYEQRIYARVLSLPSVVEACSAMGFEGKHLICMQGPFSREMNEAMLRQYDCKFLVTKDSGKAGGFQEKYEAALNCGVTPVIIGRPSREEGLSFGQCKVYLQKELGFAPKKSISLVGIGMGSPDSLTVEGKKALEEAELLIGARRMVDAVKKEGQAVCYEYRSQAIKDYIDQHPEYEKVAVALSGDVGFYSGARKLRQVLGQEATLVCGISSVVYFMAKIGLPWEDARIVSAHGKNCNLLNYIKTEPKVFAILGTETAVAKLAGKLVEYDLGQVLLYVGECLSYPEEKVFCRKACELTDYQGNALSVVCAVNELAKPLPATHGVPDEAFLRGKAPMTKEEVRTISLAKLRLAKDSICYDVGAGTGSVAVEMALRAELGRVYAIEKKEDALALLEQNQKQFALDHLTIVPGEAPAVMEPLEAPTHAFIGGSSGNLREIMELLLEKNPKVRMVINCITLETVTEALGAMKELELEHTEIVQVSVSKAKNIGRYHMMMGENPIYIITCWK